MLIMTPARTTDADALAQIDRAYAKLSESDQAFLVEISQEDIFLTQQ